MNFPYTYNFLSIDEINGFLPIKAPLAILPERYSDVQEIITNLPGLIQSGDILEKCILNLKNKIDVVNQETDVFVIQALYRAYTFLTSAYLLEPSNRNKTDGKYGVGRNILPPQLTQPLEWVATSSTKLDIS